MVSENRAIVIAGHGSPDNPTANRPVRYHADAIRQTGLFSEVRGAFWDGTPTFREAVASLPGSELIVVPLFMSHGYYVDQVLPREFRAACGNPGYRIKSLQITEPVGSHPGIRELVLRRMQSLLPDKSLWQQTGLALLGHGTTRNSVSGASVRAHARGLRDLGIFRAVKALFLDELPYIKDIEAHFQIDQVAAVPLFMANGDHLSEDIPEALGIPADHNGEAVLPGGTSLFISGPVGTAQIITDIILERISAVLTPRYGKVAI
ncbi:MAG: hypothetical protein K9N46_13270 [Candidatus Marinimicrobia bacterium]|nr:hypothetical protein [Candidatus Neomarinimicrobiota bacterium]MCF7829753.1 hypothetical protein [Candidatus Neomarinimicrobiota bacterium]MCF7881703.1 hypothetical protein [Candidatus Neomarinimicrobiota bacterium]